MTKRALGDVVEMMKRKERLRGEREKDRKVERERGGVMGMRYNERWASGVIIPPILPASLDGSLGPSVGLRIAHYGEPSGVRGGPRTIDVHCSLLLFLIPCLRPALPQIIAPMK